MMVYCAYPAVLIAIFIAAAHRVSGARREPHPEAAPTVIPQHDTALLAHKCGSACTNLHKYNMLFSLQTKC